MNPAKCLKKDTAAATGDEGNLPGLQIYRPRFSRHEFLTAGILFTFSPFNYPASISLGLIGIIIANILLNLSDIDHPPFKLNFR
jgi:hypothetical protein